MEKCILDDQFTLNDNKQEEIRKYGQKEKKKDFSFSKFIFLMILSLSFLFVVMWLLFLISKKNEQIENLKYDLAKLETKAECLENIAEMYEEKFNQIMQNVLENNKMLKEELTKLKEEINKKCNNNPPPIINKDTNIPTTINKDTTIEKKEKFKCSIF